ITRWGMGGLGPVALESDDEQPFLGYQLSQGRDYSEATAARIDQEVERLLVGRQTAVHQLLNEARHRLDTLAETLLKEETIGDAELVRILGPRPPANHATPVEQSIDPVGSNHHGAQEVRQL